MDLVPVLDFCVQVGRDIPVYDLYFKPGAGVIDESRQFLPQLPA
jgi:hypothetical protein